MAFRNSILAGTTLVRKAIKSENYVPGTTGWSINRDGTADLQNVFTRGQWRVQNNASGDAYIEGGISGNIPYLKWNTLDGLTPYSFLAQAIATGGIPRLRIHGEPLANNAALTFVQGLGIVLETNGSRSLLYDMTDGFLKMGTFAPWVAEVWHEVGSVGEPIFNNSFGNLDAINWETLAFKLMPDGTVALKGAVSRAAAAANDLQIFQLPVGYRPAKRRGFAVGNLSSHASADEPMVRVYANGGVTIWGMSAAAPTAFALDGVRFNIV